MDSCLDQEYTCKVNANPREKNEFSSIISFRSPIDITQALSLVTVFQHDNHQRLKIVERSFM